MVKSDEHGPDNPRPWDPNHWSLTVKGAPHETAAVLRMQRAGHPASKIMQVAKIKGISLVQRLQSAMTDENVAHRRGIPVHDARVPKGTV